MLIEGVFPEVAAGRYPVKRTIGDRLVVGADLVADGHDLLAGVLRVREPGDGAWREVPLVDAGGDRWEASFDLSRLGRWEYTISAWLDHFATWQRATRIKVEAGEDVSVELLVGAELVRSAAARAGDDDDARLLRELATVLANPKTSTSTRVDAGLSPRLAVAMARHPDRRFATEYERALGVVVDRERARFSNWYEMFPRSCGAPGQHGTFQDAERRLPYVASMGFDVLYLPPIHPIGVTFRKGRNNSLSCEPSEPGSPWAIGGEAGGHTAVHPELGTIDDFDRFVGAAAEHGLEVALDIAFQASPDHPWVKEHPSWFQQRPDGTIQYAENPPKKYQDIYPLDFESKDWKKLWQALRDVFLFWADHGIRIFRVDNPHTKSLRFWEWCIAEVKAKHPETIFLAEAFTRPKLMYALARLGFTQSYTYFTWRYSADDFREYMTELTRTEVAEYFRPNFWPNTPDILPDNLAHAGFGAFAGRLILAGTLAANYGIYGPAFELMENVPRPGSGEYLDNEKYELKQWNLESPNTLRYLIARLNHVRRAHPALQDNASIVFHDCDNPQLLCYSKRTEAHEDVVLCVVNLDPHNTQSGFLQLDLDELGVEDDAAFEVHDLLSEEHYRWTGAQNFVQLNPHAMPAHVFHVRRR